MLVIVGLGNPDSEYRDTLHNTGFRVIDALAGKHAIAIERKKCKALVGEGTIKGVRVALCKPQTYMNLSGESAVQLIHWYKCEMCDFLTVYDDIDLPLGTLRFRANGSAGTHNGMRNIVELTGSSDFPRLRVGIGRPPEYMDLKDYVLSKAKGDAAITLGGAIKQAAEALEAYISGGADQIRAFLSKIKA